MKDGECSRFLGYFGFEIDHQYPNYKARSGFIGRLALAMALLWLPVLAVIGAYLLQCEEPALIHAQASRGALGDSSKAELSDGEESASSRTALMSVLATSIMGLDSVLRPFFVVEVVRDPGTTCPYADHDTTVDVTSCGGELMRALEFVIVESQVSVVRFWWPHSSDMLDGFLTKAGG